MLPTMQAIFEKMKRVRILVVGDIMLDRYLWGDADRLSPEAPVPVVKVARETCTAGGAANVAHNLQALGIPVDLIGVAGQDAEGRALTAVLAGQKIGFDPQLLRRDLATIVKTRVMCRRQQLCRLDQEHDPARYALPPDFLAGVLAPKLLAADAVILSDYAKGVITSDTIRFVQAHARPQTLVALDPKPRPELEFQGVDLLTPNRAEALQLAGLHGTQADAFPTAEVVRRIQTRHQPKMLVVTLGADGMLVCRDGRPGRQIPTAAREVFDVSGAGDTVIAVLAAALAAGASLDDAAALANLAAGVVVGKVGTATATAEEILAQLRAG
jgi:rfaE bifunctional protein kinase chain/domain